MSEPVDTVQTDAQLVEAARAGDERAFGGLFDRWFDPVFDHATRILHDRDLAADAAQDAFLTAWQKLSTLAEPQAFGGWVLRIGRNRALDQLRKERRATPVDAETMAVIEAKAYATSDGPGAAVEERASAVADPERAAADAGLAEMVWESAVALGERDATVLDLHLRHGLGAGEIAEALHVTPNSAHQTIFRLRARLGAAVQARILWRHGEPLCFGLAEALAARKVVRFNADAVRVIGSHVEACGLCQERQQTNLDPAVLFASIPVIVAPALLKAKAAYALSSAGVPMSGSAAIVGPAGAAVPPVVGPIGATGTAMLTPFPKPKAKRRGRAVLIGLAAMLFVVCVGLLTAVLLENNDKPPPLPTLASSPEPSDDGGPVASLPPTFAPVVPIPPSAVPSASTTTTTSTTTSTTTTTTTLPQPRIVRFVVTTFAVPACSSPSTYTVRIEWETANASTRLLSRPGHANQAVAPTGTIIDCIAPGAKVTLTASDKRHQVKSTATVASPPNSPPIP